MHLWAYGYGKKVVNDIPLYMLTLSMTNIHYARALQQIPLHDHKPSLTVIDS